MSVFFLLTLYSAMRASGFSTTCAMGVDRRRSPAHSAWLQRKSLVVTPLIVVLYDPRVLVPRHSVRRFGRDSDFTAGCWQPWLIALGLNANRPRAESVGTHADVLLYLEESMLGPPAIREAAVFWPSDLVMDYGPPRILALHQIVLARRWRSC